MPDIEKLKVAQYGVGPTGAKIILLAREKPALEIVGAVDVDPAKVGKDLGRVAGAAKPWGIVVSDSAADILSLRPDIVLHSTVSRLSDAARQILECVRAGACVISTCEELAYPYAEHADAAQEIDRAAREHGVAVLGAGVNPGFVMDRLVLYLSGVCQRVDAVKVKRIVNASERRLPLQKKVGAGVSRSEFMAGVASGGIKHYGLPESARMIAGGLGMKLDSVEETIRPVMARHDVRTAFLKVPKGKVAGVRQVCIGKQDGKIRVRLELRVYVGAEDPVDAITIAGMPAVRAEIPGGIHGDVATAAVIVNSIPWVMAATPGLWTSADLPIRYYAGTAQSAGDAP
ncbi:MAG: NAD(P)H-dependent amine dehydrogenase family protein [bacterium]